MANGKGGCWLGHAREMARKRHHAQAHPRTCGRSHTPLPRCLLPHAVYCPRLVYRVLFAGGGRTRKLTAQEGPDREGLWTPGSGSVGLSFSVVMSLERYRLKPIPSYFDSIPLTQIV